MSQIWSYYLLVPEKISLSNERLSEIGDLLKRVGFSTANPVSGLIDLFGIERKSLDPIEKTCERIEDILPHVNVPGLLLTIWKGDVDARIGFDLHGEDQGWVRRIAGYPEDIPFGTISISIDNTHFRPDNANRSETADQLLSLFKGLCQIFDPAYGFLLNEDIYETYIFGKYDQPDTHQTETPQKRKIHLLFRANYLSKEYCACVDTNEILERGAKIEPFHKGIFVSFFENP